MILRIVCMIIRATRRMIKVVFINILIVGHWNVDRFDTVIAFIMLSSR